MIDWGRHGKRNKAISAIVAYLVIGSFVGVAALRAGQQERAAVAVTTTSRANVTPTTTATEATRRAELAFMDDYTSDMLLFVVTVGSHDFDDSMEVARAVSALEGIGARVDATEAPTLRTQQMKDELSGSVRVFLSGWTASLEGRDEDALWVFEDAQDAAGPAGERIGEMWGELMVDIGYEMTDEQRALFDSIQ